MKKQNALDADSAVELQYAIVTALREGFGLDELAAAAMAEPFANSLRRHYACENLYIPAPDKRLRNEAIRREFNGRNRAEVCRKWGISRTQLYAIVKAVD